MSIEDHVITVTAKDALAAGSRRVKMVATFNGHPTAAGSMSAHLGHVVNTLRPVQGASKDSLAKCTVTIRNPMKDAVSKQQEQVSPSTAASAVAEQHTQLRPEPSSRASPSLAPAKRAPAAASSTPPYPPFLSESAITLISSKMPSPSVDALSPAVAEAATLMQNEYARTATNVQRAMRSLQQAWVSLHRTSNAASGMTHSSRSLSPGCSVSSDKRGAGRAPLSSAEQEPSAAPPLVSSAPLELAAPAPNVACECTCDKFLSLGIRSGDACIPAGCTGLCGLANVSHHDMWALGVILYRFAARESLWSEDDEDNIKNGSGHLLELVLWTDAFKQERLQKIDDTATR